MEPKLKISDVFSTAWKFTKSQIWVLAGLFIGYSIFSIIISLFSMPAQSSTIGQILIQTINALISGIFSLGYLKNIFQTLDGEEPQFSAYGQQSRKVFTYLISTLIVSLITIVGLVFLIIPGIYLYLRLQFYSAFIVDENCGIMDSLKRSWEVTRGNTGTLFLLTLVCIGVVFLGLILLFVGLLVAIPFIYMMQCYAYRKLNTIPVKQTEIEY